MAARPAAPVQNAPVLTQATRLVLFCLSTAALTNMWRKCCSTCEERCKAFAVAMFQVSPLVAGAPGADPDDVCSEQHGRSHSLEDAEELAETQHTSSWNPRQAALNLPAMPTWGRQSPPRLLGAEMQALSIRTSRHLQAAIRHAPVNQTAHRRQPGRPRIARYQLQEQGLMFRIRPDMVAPPTQPIRL